MGEGKVKRMINNEQDFVMDGEEGVKHCMVGVKEILNLYHALYVLPIFYDKLVGRYGPQT